MANDNIRSLGDRKAPNSSELRGLNGRLQALFLDTNENAASDIPKRRAILDAQSAIARLIEMQEH